MGSNNDRVVVTKGANDSHISSWSQRSVSKDGEEMFDPYAHIPRPNRSLIYFGACIIAGLRLAREKQVSVRVVPTGIAIEESAELAHEIFNKVFRKVPEQLSGKGQ